MEYSEEFKQKVLTVLNNGAGITELLATRDEKIGSQLKNYFDFLNEIVLRPDMIIEAFESLNFKKLYELAKKAQAVEEVYKEWCDLKWNTSKEKQIYDALRAPLPK